MAKLLVLYNKPADPAAFDHYYHQTHIPLAKKIPGLRSYAINEGPVQALAGTPPHLVAILRFDSMADLNAALTSPEGQLAAADFGNFASGGRDIVDLRQQDSVNARALITRFAERHSAI